MLILIIFQILGEGHAAPQVITENEKTEIVLIATLHSILFLNPRYTPAHLRALLTKINPVAVCIEELKDTQESISRLPTWPQELYATLTWAKKKNVPVWHVDWEDKEQIRQIQSSQKQLPNENMTEKRFKEFKASYRNLIIWEAKEVFGESNNDIESWHNIKRLEGIELKTRGSISQKTKTSDDIRDDHIADNILNVASKYRRKKIAVVYGGYHYLPQTRRLEKHKHIKLTSASKYLPLSKQEVEAGWHDDDAFILLGANLDSWEILGAPQSRNHQRSKNLLNRLSLKDPHSPITRYYKAKWRLNFGDLSKAKKILEGILEDGTKTSLPYQPHPRWSWPPFSTIEQKARFYIAAIYDLENRHEKAVMHYKQLLDLRPESLLIAKHWRSAYMDLRWYLESLITDPYRGGLWEAFRVSEAIRY